MAGKAGKGGKNRRRGKNDAFGDKRELILKEPCQEYAQVLKMLGNGRLEAQCVDGAKRLCHIRGKMRKKVWINAGDVVLVSLREYQDEKGDIIHKYNPDEVRTLKQMREIPEAFRVVETIGAGEGYGSDDDGDDIGFENQDDQDVIDIEDL
ncbi:eukaryotic translation initiation factor 1A [Gregarina niphandrodes]|uniref:Eukaryotic translation initiation factor 4C n=1 Tax=Gregarina niphandrodes TaxID=110365 RepID=A0A023B4F5_GRENI|nr:eukaryotic translation initiation factor 1A [Gregarina niphandrodes]EZG56350.1 eukaryotic translation initiation factor 1A [Gregarina niphandrodes]|eukprot:XP_011131279.1 eukaryotic translation initiation factor 1A [Gregarina niphandrodes]